MAEKCDIAKRIVIRSYLASDQDEARWLILNGLGEHFGVIDESLNPDVDDIGMHYLAAGHRFIVAILDEMLVGTAGLLMETPLAGRIVRVSVMCRYRRLGIGRALVDHLLELARQQGLHHVFVETNHDWLEVIHFYQNQGFTEYARDLESAHMCLCLN